MGVNLKERLKIGGGGGGRKARRISKKSYTKNQINFIGF